MLISRKQVPSSFTDLLLYYSIATLLYPDILTKLYCNYTTLCLWSTVRANILYLTSKLREPSAPRPATGVVASSLCIAPSQGYQPLSRRLSSPLDWLACSAVFAIPPFNRLSPSAPSDHASASFTTSTSRLLGRLSLREP